MAPPNKTPQPILDAIVEAYLRGKTMKQASALFGKSKIVCEAELKARGIVVKRRPRTVPVHNKTSDSDLDAMIAAYMDGNTAEEAAARYGKTYGVCLDELARRGIAARSCKTDQAILDEIVGLYLRGATAKDASAAFGKDCIVCLDELKRRGIACRPAKKLTEAQLDKLVQLYLDGATGRQASALFGVTAIVCLQELKKRGIKARIGKDCSTEVEAQIVSLYHAGELLKTIEKSAGVSKRICRKVLKANGLKLADRLTKVPVEMCNSTSKDVLDDIIEAYAEGRTARESAEMYGKTKGVCLNELKRRGITARPRKTPQHILDAVVQSYLDGNTVEEASGAHGLVSTKPCLDELKRRGVVTRKTMSKNKAAKSRTPQPILDGVVEAYLAGRSAHEASALFGKSSIVCVNELKRRGIKAYSSHEYWSRGFNIGFQGMPRGEDGHYEKIPWPVFMKSFEYKNWRQSVFRRDGFICVDCRKRGGNLEAHHIFRKSIFPHLALIKENGVTLCENCHYALRKREEKHAERFLRKIVSTVRPLVWFDVWPDRLK